MTDEINNAEEINNDLIEQAIKKATAGLVSNRDQLLREKKEIQQQLKTLQEQWQGLDADQVKSLMHRLKHDEEAKLIANGEIDKVIAKRTEILKHDYDKRLEVLSSKEKELSTALEDEKKRVRELVISSAIRQASSDLGVVPSAIEDVLSRAKNLFDLEDNNTLVARDSDGSIKLGKNGKDAMTPTEWVEAMRDKAPHWFPSPSGSGAMGGSRAKNGAITITRSQARNPQLYREAKRRAESAGQQLQLIDD